MFIAGFRPHKFACFPPRRYDVEKRLRVPNPKSHAIARLAESYHHPIKTHPSHPVRSQFAHRTDAGAGLTKPLVRTRKPRVMHADDSARNQLSPPSPLRMPRAKQATRTPQAGRHARKEALTTATRKKKTFPINAPVGRIAREVNAEQVAELRMVSLQDFQQSRSRYHA